ncbi:MAG: hypothetical protein WA890_29815, partial [Micromonospora sp.]
MRWTANAAAVWSSLGAVVLGAAAVAESALRTASHPAPAFAALTALGMAAPVALARIWPGVAAGLSAAACLLGLLTGAFPPGAGLVALAVLCFMTGARRPVWATALLALPFAAYS